MRLVLRGDLESQYQSQIWLVTDQGVNEETFVSHEYASTLIRCNIRAKILLLTFKLKVYQSRIFTNLSTKVHHNEYL